MAAFVQRPAREPDRLAFETEVVACEGTAVELAETYFFAESGGQPADRGTIAGHPVREVRIEEDRILHDVEGDLADGDVVRGEVDPDFRRYCRRAHTASHVLYGAARRELDDLGYGGFEIDERKVRLDFESARPIDDDRAIAIERLANEAVWDDRAVSWEQIPRMDALDDPEIAFNAATEDVFGDAGTVRIVEIEGWDRAACGGTHLHSTAEIGPITILDRSNPGSGLTRIEFAVGPTAIDHVASVHGAARTAARRLNATPDELHDAVEELEDRLETRRERIEQLERRLVTESIASFETTRGDGRAWLSGTLPDVDSEVVATALRTAAANSDVDAVIGLSGDDRTAITVATDGELDAGTIVERVTAELGGGGGGGPDYAQGGGIPQSPSDVVPVVDDVMEATSK